MLFSPLHGKTLKEFNAVSRRWKQCKRESSTMLERSDGKGELNMVSSIDAERL